MWPLQRSLFFCFFVFVFVFLFVYLVSFFRFHYLDVVASRERRWESRRNEFSKFASQIITVPSLAWQLAQYSFISQISLNKKGIVIIPLKLGLNSTFKRQRGYTSPNLIFLVCLTLGWRVDVSVNLVLNNGTKSQNRMSLGSEFPSLASL